MTQQLLMLWWCDGDGNDDNHYLPMGGSDCEGEAHEEVQIHSTSKSSTNVRQGKFFRSSTSKSMHLQSDDSSREGGRT